MNKNITIYFKPKILMFLWLGIMSGLPLVLTASTMAVWMMEQGVDIKTIGLFSFVWLPYSLKFIWAPVIDGLKLPILYKIFGRRKSWMLFSQSLLVISILKLSTIDPLDNIMLTALYATLVAFFSATQDIVIDAFRLETLSDREQAAGTAINTIGYRIGMLIAGAGALFLAEYYSWENVYSFMGLIILAGMSFVLFITEPKIYIKNMNSNTKLNVSSLREILYQKIIMPFTDFMQKDQWVLILLLVMFYKLCDAFVGHMINPFWIEIGFSKAEIATYAKTLGFMATIAGSLVAGSTVYKYGIKKTLWFCAYFQIATNLTFLLQYYVGYDVNVFAFTIGIESFSAGMGGAVFVAYLSSICTNNLYTATQYALLASIASLGRTTLSAPSGYFVDWFGWGWFFIISAILGIPSIILLRILHNRTNGIKPLSHSI
jgi:MFS transporter, PAT family, beta-lactamase induction signal transducer AmpG